MKCEVFYAAFGRRVGCAERERVRDLPARNERLRPNSCSTITSQVLQTTTTLPSASSTLTSSIRHTRQPNSFAI
jgi:hypothetical protein